MRRPPLRRLRRHSAACTRAAAVRAALFTFASEIMSGIDLASVHGFGEGFKPKVPERTAAASIISSLHTSGDGLHMATVGKPATFVVSSNATSAADGAIFFARLVGPALLPVDVTTVREGQQHREWRFTYRAYDAGQYHLDVVLEYSHNQYRGPFATDWYEGARAMGGDRQYEGFELEGSPFTVYVHAATTHSRDEPHLRNLPRHERMHERAETTALPGMLMPWCDPAMPLEGRWVVCPDSMAAGSPVATFSEARWCWRAARCRTLPASSFGAAALNRCAPGGALIFLLGDSIMGQQKTSLRAILHGLPHVEERYAFSERVNGTRWDVDYQQITNGVTLRGPQGPWSLLEAVHKRLRRECRTRPCALVFNDGIHNAYSRFYGRLRLRHLARLDDFRMADYADALNATRHFLEPLPLRARMFRTTTAAWMKYGNVYTDFNRPAVAAAAAGRHEGEVHQQRFWESHWVRTYADRYRSY